MRNSVLWIKISDIDSDHHAELEDRWSSFDSGPIVRGGAIRYYIKNKSL